MAVPIFEDFLYPFLQATEKKDMSISEMKQYIIGHFHLSEEDCSIRTKSGNATQVSDRLNWVRQYLRRARQYHYRCRDVQSGGGIPRILRRKPRSADV